jgi:two-component system response regulator FixJ
MFGIVSETSAAARVVIVEDDRDLALVLQATLEPKGYSVTILTEAAGAVAAITSQRTDLLVLDIFIGGVSGIDLLKAVRKLRADLPVLVMSGMSTIAIAVESIKLGAADFLEKPFALDRFADLVDRFARPAPAAAIAVPTTGLTLLTGREHEVLAQIARGASSKEAGRVLGISPRTVDVHRARIKEKLNVRRAVDLVRLVYTADSGKN